MAHRDAAWTDAACLFDSIEREVRSSGPVGASADERAYLREYYRPLLGTGRFFRYHFVGKTALLLRIVERVRKATPTEPVSVLDVGCGPGSQCLLLKSHGASAIGIDRSSLAIATANRRLATGTFSASAAGDAEFREVDACQFNPDEFPPFDIVFSQQALAQLPCLDEFLRRVSKNIKPEGFIVVSEGNPRHPVNAVRRIRRGNQHSLMGPQLLARALAAVGFAAEQHRGYGLIPPPLVEMSSSAMMAAIRLEELVQDTRAGLAFGLTYATVARRVS